jgi:hypothetical protein
MVEGVVTLGNVSGAKAIDASQGNMFTLTLTGNATLSVSNVQPGQSVLVVATQDGAGDRTITWAGQTMVVPNGSSAQPLATAGAVSAIELVGSAVDLSTVTLASNAGVLGSVSTVNAVGTIQTVTPTSGPITLNVNNGALAQLTATADCNINAITSTSGSAGIELEFLTGGLRGLKLDTSAVFPKAAPFRQVDLDAICADPTIVRVIIEMTTRGSATYVKGFYGYTI